MKRTAQVAVIGALLAVGVAQSYAQSPFVVSSLNVALTGFAGDTNGVTAVKISNKDIIAALNAGGNSFSKSAKLLIEVPAGGGSPAFVVRDGSTDTDVSGSFTTESTGTVSNGKQQYEILTVTFDSGSGTDFTVSGFSTAKIGTVSGKDTGKLTGEVISFTATVAGTGDVNGTPGVLKGTVSATGAKGEMH